MRPFHGRSHALSAFDLHRLTSGSAHLFGFITAATIQEVCKKFAVNRRTAHKAKLRWRNSSKALGWVPFRRQDTGFKNGRFNYAGHSFRVFDSYDLGNCKLRAGSFSQNTLGEWFLNVAVEVQQVTETLPTGAVGVDLGVKATATCSDGKSLSPRGLYRDNEMKIKTLQRRGHKKQVKRLHKKVVNRRKDALHKFSSMLVRENGAIYIGDVSAARMAKTHMAKAVADASWQTLKRHLTVKSHWAGRICEVVRENNTTRTCSNCGCITGPKGLRQLAVRFWDCEACGTSHDRDCNAAMNILRIGLGKQPPLAGTQTQATHKPSLRI